MCVCIVCPCLVSHFISLCYGSVLFTLNGSYVLQMVEKGTSVLKKLEINVAEAEKRTGKNTVNMQETYTVYLVETRWGLLKDGTRVGIFNIQAGFLLLFFF